MDENNNKNQVLNAMMNVQYYPVPFEEENIKEKYTKLPLIDIAALGIAFEPLAAAFQSISQMGSGELVGGLYRVTNPTGVSGHIAALKDGSGYISTIVNETGIAGQARLNPIVLNPTLIFVAIAIKAVDQKLNTILEISEEMFEFLKEKEKAKSRGNLKILEDVLNNYKYNWNNEKYKTNKHIQVQEIKRDAEQSILFHREQIEKKVSKKAFFHGEQDVKSKLKKIQSEFQDYQLSLYLYSFSSFLEVMLLENFESGYLNSVSNRIEDYSYQYRELYTRCYDQIEEYSKSAIPSQLLKGLAGVNKVAGKTVAKVPVVSKSKIDEALIDAGEWIGKFNARKTERTMDQFINHQSSCVQPFIDNINVVNSLYNEPIELLVDDGNLYFSLPENGNHRD